MDRDVRFAALHRGFEFTREKSLAAALLKRPFGLLVAGRDDLQQLRLDPELIAQMRRDHLRLREGERALPSGKDKFRHAKKSCAGRGALKVE